MFKGKIKEDRYADPYETIRRILPSAKAEDTLCIFRYSLDLSIPDKRCDGIFYADPDYIRLIEGGSIALEIKTKDVRELKMSSGVGCIFVSYKLRSDGSEHLLCRSDMSASKHIIHVLKKFNHYLEEGKRIGTPTDANDGLDRCE